MHRGSRLVTAEGRLTDEQGRLLAHGSATFALNGPPGCDSLVCLDRCHAGGGCRGAA